MCLEDSAIPPNGCSCKAVCGGEITVQCRQGVGCVCKAPHFYVINNWCMGEASAMAMFLQDGMVPRMLRPYDKSGGEES